MAKKKGTARAGTASKTRKSKGRSGGTKVSSNGSARHGSGKRELIDTGRDKRYVRRDGDGQFKESDDMGKSLSQDRRRKAKRTVKAGQGDKGDQRR